MTEGMRPRTTPSVLLCGASGCTGEEGDIERVTCALRSAADVAVVGCQGVCGGPLIGLRLHGRLRWLGPLVTEPQLAAVLDVLERTDDPALPPVLRPLQQVKPTHGRTAEAG